MSIYKIDEISINDDGGEVLMNLLNTDLEIGQEVDFEIRVCWICDDMCHQIQVSIVEYPKANVEIKKSS